MIRRLLSACLAGCSLVTARSGRDDAAVPFQIVHRPDTLAVMHEAYHLFRIIPIDREHAEYLPPAWMGHSVARWDGDTLVVDVRGFNDRTSVAGHRHTYRGAERLRGLTP